MAGCAGAMEHLYRIVKLRREPTMAGCAGAMER